MKLAVPVQPLYHAENSCLQLLFLSSKNLKKTPNETLQYLFRLSLARTLFIKLPLYELCFVFSPTTLQKRLLLCFIASSGRGEEAVT